MEKKLRKSHVRRLLPTEKEMCNTVKSPVKIFLITKPLMLLNIRIKTDDRDALRFHWIKERDPNQIEILRYTRLVFGLIQFPFILGGTLQEHLETYIEKYPIEVAEIKDDLYVDDLISGGNSGGNKSTATLKDIAIEIFNQAGPKLH